MTRKQLANVVITRCLEFGKFKLKSGTFSDFYIDLRKLTLSSDISMVTTLLDPITRNYTFNAVGGPTVGADPIVGAYLQVKKALRGFLVRPETKDHGKPELIIGSVKRGDKCLLLEDVTTTGQSLIRVINLLEQMDCSVALIVSILDRDQGAAETFARRNVPFCSILTMEDIYI